MHPDIVLVNPLFISKDPVEQRIMTPYFPLGLMYLGAVLRQHDYQVEMFDCAFRNDFDEFAAYLKRTKPSIVGLTSLITTRRNALILADIAHQQGCTVILGGPDPTGVPDRYLHHRGAGNDHPVDIVAFDEAETTMIELMDHLMRHGNPADQLRDIAGLRLRGENDTVVSTPPRPLIQDVTGLPFPARDLVDLDVYRENWIRAHGYWSLSMINTRGCPYACSWCQKAVFGRTFRTRSPENSADEMRLIKDQYAPDQLRIVDDITGVNKKWVLEWRDAVAERNASIPFECLTRVNLASEEMLTALNDIGCKKIYFGAESGSQKVLDAMNKGIKVEQIYEASRLCKKLNISTYFFMMVGYPTEEWDDLKQSIALLRECKPETFSTTIAYPLPGTPFYEQMRDRLMFDADWNLDWEYSAENRLLFRREKYNTLFYKWVIFWFHKEWEDANLKPGDSLIEHVRVKAGLLLSRFMVNLLARIPTASQVRFQPAEGR